MSARKLYADGWPCSNCSSPYDPCDCPDEVARLAAENARLREASEDNARLAARVKELEAALRGLLSAQEAVSRIRNGDAERLDYDGSVDRARAALAAKEKM